MFTLPEYFYDINIISISSRLLMAVLFGGIIGLETALPLAITVLVNGGHLTMMQVLEKMAYNPAQMYHLDAGYLAEGGPADIIIIDKDAIQVFEEYASKASNTPFTGWELDGVVCTTICDGKVVFSA